MKMPPPPKKTNGLVDENDKTRKKHTKCERNCIFAYTQGDSDVIIVPYLCQLIFAAILQVKP